MKKWIRPALIFLFSATFLVSGFMIVRYYTESRKQSTQFHELADMVKQARPNVVRPTSKVPASDSAEPGTQGEPSDSLEAAESAVREPLPEYVEVSKLNPDMVGWMIIEGTKIDYPVMQTPQQKDKYLHLDFYGKYSGHGCLYAREDCGIDPASDNITIYGHNMKDGSMFASLLKYGAKSFWESHRYIYFDTLMERHTYEIFAVFRTTASKGKGFTYHQFINAKDEQEFDQFISDCKAIDLYDTGITPQYGEKLITLSTCEYSQQNGRFVVVARRID